MWPIDVLLVCTVLLEGISFWIRSGRCNPKFRNLCENFWFRYLLRRHFNVRILMPNIYVKASLLLRRRVDRVFYLTVSSIVLTCFYVLSVTIIVKWNIHTGIRTNFIKIQKLGLLTTSATTTYYHVSRAPLVALWILWILIVKTVPNTRVRSFFCSSGLTHLSKYRA